jgi:hypothetical protein
MAKHRKQIRKGNKPQNQPTVVHHYTAEVEEKKDKRKKLKIKSLLGGVAALLGIGIGILLWIFLF